MKETVLRTTELTKLYKTTTAVDHVNMHVKKGDIYGFIGENGAGKTTLIRMITGLIFPTSGEMALFSDTPNEGFEEARKRIGCIIEGPAFFPKMTAQQNLEYYRIQRGIPDKAVVSEVLNKVNLADTGKKRFQQFSLGMNQRLGLALAIMGNPDFLILDEPTNGMDPMGIIEFRNILHRLNQEQNMTILISSHILSEFSQVANTFGIIHKGKLIKEISKTQLDEETKQTLSVKVDNASMAATILEQSLQIRDYEVLPGNEIRIHSMLDNPSEITFQLNQNGVRVESIYEVGTSLEDYFLKTIGYVTGGKNND